MFSVDPEKPGYLCRRSITSVSKRHALHRWLIATTALSALVVATLGVSTQGGPAPILVVVNSASANPYGNYLGEILKAEGLNSYSIVQLSTVTPTTLSSSRLVVLAETTLSASQALMFTNYVAGGGPLIVMRPDPQLLPVLGLTAETSSTTEGYFALNQGNSFATGFPSTTLPFHGQARHYTPATETQVLATVYSNSTTATAFPAVVRNLNTVTWTYDLASSVILTRQGNPANASDRDGQPPYRTTDIFYNAIDRDKVPIPFADVQMRMFARAIGDLLSDTMPLPRMWYFPGSNKTLVVLTGDAHANPQSYYDEEISDVESFGGRISIYAYGGNSPSPSSAATWRSRGHEIGMHPAGAQSGSSLTTAFQNNLTWFTGLYGISPSATSRNHQVEWQGWVDAAKVAANFGMRMDTSFYTWGPSVTYPDGHQAHGYINGSGQPMRFIDQAGVIVPVYQQVTSLIDEGLITTDFSEHLTPAAGLAVSRQIIDASQAGDYAAVMTQFHVDYFGFGDVNTWATGTMSYARSLSVPMWTAERWLNYTTARHATTITGVSWSPASRELFFTVTVPAGSETQSVALPHHFAGFGLTGVTVDGVAATSLQQPISGRPTSFFNVTAGAHSLVASYNTPLPTAVLGVAPQVITQGQSSTLSWSTTNATTVSIDQGIGTVAATGTRTVNPLVTTTYNITATNTAGSVTTPAKLTVIPPAPTVTASVNPTTIAAGDPATLSWATTNAETVTITPGIGAVPPTGTLVVSPSATTTYTVTVTNITASANATATLNVNPPPPGSSLRFNGSNQRARFTTLPSQAVYTVEGWVKRTTDTGRWETFFSNVNASYSAATFNLYVDGGNADCGSSPADQFAWAYTRTTGGFVVQCSGVAASLNTWYHVAITRDSANAIRIFINGVLRGTATGTAAPSSTGFGPFNIGEAGEAADEYFPGFLDEIRVSSVARYTGNFTPQTARFATDANTVALYHLDEGVGQTLNDASGNGRTGFLGLSSATEAIDPTWSTDVAFTGGPPTNAAPTITAQPANQTVTAGQNATFTVLASSTPTPTYQWQVSTNGGGTFTNLANGAPYSGVTTTALTITAAAAGLSGNQYRAVATNSQGSATSTAALLTLNVAPAFTAQPTNQTIVPTQNGTFTATVTGTPTPTLQWQVSTNGGGTFTNLANGAPYSGVTTASLTLTGVTTALNNNQYRLAATNSAGTVTSTAAVLTVTATNVAPTITTQPVNQAATIGGNASFVVAASGAPTPTYQWQVSVGGGAFANLTNTSPYSGVTTATLTITAATTALSSNQYRAIATNTVASATSNAATLTVTAAAPGASLQFNGSSQRARFTSLPSMPIMTVEGWVKRTSDTGGYETFFSDADSGYGQVAIGVFVDGGNTDCGSPSDQFAWAYTKTGGGWFLQCSGVTADLNVWHHIAVTRDASNTARMFVDGVLKATTTNTAAALATTGFFGIGEAGDAVTEFFPGRLDEIRISNVARYTSTFTPQTSNFLTDADTVALYHLDEGGGQTLGDASGNGRNGFLGTANTSEASDPVWSTDIPFAGAPPPVLPTINFTASPQTITAGNSATLSWSTTNATDASIDQNIGSIPLVGTIDVSPTTTTTYTLTAFNANGLATATTTLTVNAANVAPAITTQPANQTVTAGQNASFTVAASGTPAPTYQWQVSVSGGAFTNLTNTAPYSGVTATTMTITGATAGLSGNQYRAVATNIAGSATSTAALLTVNVAPSFTAQPTNQSIVAGQNGAFSATVTGTPTPTVQWQISTNGGGTFTNLTNTAPYSGVTTTTLTLTGATTGLNNNQYRLVATNSAGTGTSTAAVLTVTAANVAPAITTQPSNQTVAAGGNTSLVVAASGAPTPTYQWQVSIAGGAFTNLANAAPYSGVTTTTLTITAATAGLSGNQYRAIATNAAGSATSNAALLTVNVAPAITTQPANQTVNSGQNASLAVTASGTPAPTYQWQVSVAGGAFTNLTNSAPYSGVTTTTLTITAATAGLSGNQYRAVATNSAGSATSTAATLTVNVAPAVTTQPANQSVTTGQNASFTVAASGTPTPTYQWQVSIGGGAFTNLTNTAPYSGATTTTLTITAATVGLSGNQYRAVATNTVGTGTSSAATLTVGAALPGGSLVFNGTTQFARFTTLPAMTVFTVEGWVKRTSDTGRYETFLSNASSSYGQETVGVYVDGGNGDCGSSPSDQFAWAYTRAGGGWFFQCSGVSATLNTWFHIAVTRDASNVTRIFINGVLRNTMTGTAAPTTSTGAFAIGTAADALTEFFPGLLDEVRISSVARYSATFTPQTTPYATDASTIALYHLDELTGQTLTDSSGNNRNGVLGSTSAAEAADPARSTDAPVH